MDAGLVAARFLHLSTTAILFGGSVFVAWLAPPSLRPDLAARFAKSAPALALLSLASAAAWLVLLAGAMAESGLSLEAVSDVLFSTAFGEVWRWRLAILALLLAATLRPDPGWRAPTALAGLATASLALVGHAAMQDGLVGALHRLNRAGHLLAVSFWLGGLPPFVFTLAMSMRAPERIEARTALLRFSQAGRFAVIAAFATGLLDAALTLRTWPWPPVTAYRAGLTAKAAVFAAMTALALVNRYVFAPRAGHNPAAARGLAAGAVLEIGLGLAAVALVSGFATLEPV